MTPESPTPSSGQRWKLRHPEYCKAASKARNDAIRKDPVAWAKKLQQNRVSRKKHAAAYRAYDIARDALKVAARNIIRDRIYRGVLKRQPCEVCGNPKSHAHHDNYSKRLEVRWLCAQHHADLHNGKLK